MDCSNQKSNNSALSNENAKIDLSWLSTITTDIDKMAQIKLAEKFKSSEAQAHMAAYEKLLKFRQSISENMVSIENVYSRDAEKQQLMEAAKCLDEAKAMRAEIGEFQERIDTNMAEMRKNCT